MPPAASMLATSRAGRTIVSVAHFVGVTLAACNPSAHSQTVIGRTQIMTTSSYPIRFASPGRTSALNVATPAKGILGWSQPIGTSSSPEWPPTVLDWGGRPVVVTPTHLTVFDSQGTRLWTQERQVGTPAVVFGGHLYFKGKHRFIDAVDSRFQAFLNQVPFPGAMSAAVRVSLFWPRETDFVAVLQVPGDGEVPEGSPPDTVLAQPYTTLLKNRYPTTYGDWRIDLPGELRLPPLLLPAHHVMAIATTEVVRVDVERFEELSRFPLPLPELVDWSVSADEVYTVTGYDKRHKVLLAVASTGEVLWRWTDTADTDRWAGQQPPVRSSGDRIYALTDGRVLAFERGKLLWVFDARDAALKHGARVDEGSFEIKDGRLLARGSLRHASALADGSLLVTGNRTLHHLSPNGRVIFQVNVGEDILSPPVVDSDGHIFIASASRLMRID